MAESESDLPTRQRGTLGLCVRCMQPLPLAHRRCSVCGQPRPESGWIPTEEPADLALPHARPLAPSGGDGMALSPIVLELPNGHGRFDEGPSDDPDPGDLDDELEMPESDAGVYDDMSDPTGLTPDEGRRPSRLRVRVMPAGLDQADEDDVVVPPQARTERPEATPGAHRAVVDLFAGRFRLVEARPGIDACRVHLAVQEPMVRRVELGILDLLGGELQAATEARFLREAALLARRGHPNLAALLDFGRAPDGRCFLVGELLYGFTLREVLDRGPLVEARLVPIAIDLCRGLSACHEVGLAHRGVNAANVTLESGPGLAPADTLARLGMAGLGLVPERLGPGSAPELLRSLPPEVLAGEPPGPAADVYALGALLCEALVGRPPFAGDAAALLAARPRPVPGELEALEAGGGRRGALARLAIRCLHPDPGVRPTVDGDLLPALGGLARDVERRQVVPAQVGWRVLFAAALAGAVLPTFALAALGAWWVGRPEPLPVDPPLVSVPDLAAVTRIEPPAPPPAPVEVPSPPTAAAPAPVEEALPAPPPRAVAHRSEPRAVARATPPPPRVAPAPEPAAELEPAPAFAPRPVVMEVVAPPEPAPPAPEPPPPPHPAAASLGGLWLGQAAGQDLALDLAVGADGAITGSARLRRGGSVESAIVVGRVAQVEGAWWVELQVLSGERAQSYSGRLEAGSIQGRVTQGGRSKGRWKVAR